MKTSWRIGVRPGLFLIAPAFSAAAVATQGPYPKVVEIEDEDLQIYTRVSIGGDTATAFAAHWAKKNTEDVLAIADRLIEQDKEDFRGHAVKYLAWLELGKDRQKATLTAVRALRDLGGKPHQLAEFINRGLFAAPTVSDYQLALMALVPVLPDARNVGSVRVAHIRALIGCRKVKEALVTNKKIVADLGDDPAALLLLAKALCDTDGARPMGEIARQAIDRVIETRGATHPNLLVKFRVLHDLLGATEEAKSLGGQLVAKISQDNINNWLWYLMTKRSSAGKYRGLVLMAARKMERAATLAYNEHDTLALALYRNGLIDEAIERQNTAIAQGGGNDPGYTRRLKMYTDEKERRAKARRDSDK